MLVIGAAEEEYVMDWSDLYFETGGRDVVCVMARSLLLSEKRPV